jgi:DNA (cytosine-5)-methyltransferase 1
LTKTSKNFDFVDLFAGIGGMRLAFEAVGGRCVLTCEIDEAALTTYQANFNPKHPHTYVRDIKDAKKLPKHDVLVAGFPCQPYSIAGLREGLKDARGQVFLEIIRILKSSKPQAFLLENVKGMRSHDGGRTFEYMREQLESCGYYIQDETLNSAVHANVPQNRERVFVVGFRDKEMAKNFKFPEPIRLTKTIKSFVSRSVTDNRYFYDSRFDCFADIKKVVTSPDTVYQWRRKYVRENKSNVCPALTANMGSGGHNVPLIRVDTKIRKLTPRECAKFQGFPNNFVLPEISDSKLYHQFGNSVTVPLIERIAAAMTEVM